VFPSIIVRRPRDRIEALSTILTVDSLLKDTKLIEDWEELGKALGISQTKITELDESYEQESDKKKALLKEFIMSDTSHHKIYKLEEALKEMGHAELAAILLTKYLGTQVTKHCFRLTSLFFIVV